MSASCSVRPPAAPRDRRPRRGPAALPLAAVLALVAACTSAAAAAAPPMRPMPLDSLVHVDLKRERIIAGDMGALAMLRRESEYAADQFRRYLGTSPPVLGIAALGTLPHPERVSDAALHLAKYDYVMRDWPRRPGAPRPTLDSTATEWIEPASERIMRWYFPIIERDLGRGVPAEGRARFAPDWFETAMAGFGTLPAEQNVRVAWMDAHMSERIPIEKFLHMARPEARPPGARRRAGNRQGPSEPTRRLFDAEALSFARFLSNSEGERFIGHFYEQLLLGQPQSAAFNIARTLLPDPGVLEKAWIAWVNEGPRKKINVPGSHGDEE